MGIEDIHSFTFDTPTLEDFRLIESNSESKENIISTNFKKVKNQDKLVESRLKEMKQKDVKCLGQTALFVGHSGESTRMRETRIIKAKEICQTCILIEPCREGAYRRAEIGVRGGESEVDRYLKGAPVDTISPEIVHFQRSIGKRAS
jgi:hypothetical protein